MLLGEAIKLLPLVMRHRYRELDFWIPIANRVLGEIEVISDQREMLLYEPIIVADSVTRYRLPERIRKFRYLRQPDLGTPLLDKWPVVQYDLAGRNVQLTYPVPFYDDAPIGGNIDSVADGIQIFSTALDAVDDLLTSRLVQFTKVDGSTYSGLVATNTAGSLTLDGPALVDPEAGDTFTVTRNFLMVEGERYLPRFSAEVDDHGAPIGLTQAIPLPAEWEELMLIGLRYYGELQTDENGVNVPNWFSQWEKAKFNYKADHRTPRGEMKRQRPAAWPQLGA